MSRGRPPHPDEPRSAMLPVGLGEVRKAALVEACSRLGISQAEGVRRAVDAWLRSIDRAGTADERR